MDNTHVQSNPFGLERPEILDLAPPQPRNVEETGLPLGLLTELALRHLYQKAALTGVRIAEEIGLPYAGVIEEAVSFLADERLVEMRGGKGFGRASFSYSLTERGRERAREAMLRTAYVGRAPIPLEQYSALIKLQNQESQTINGERLREHFGNMVLPEDFFDRLGPAINSSRSLFLFGPPGNGKTTVAERISGLLGGEVFVPHAIEVDGSIIKVFDPLCHMQVELDRTASKTREPTAIQKRSGPEYDRRWVLCRRPSVMVGGELTLETLDLIFHPNIQYYEAPFQVKANGGMLLIDDFGRQRVHPSDLLNRWIVPLEKGSDFLTLHTGKKFEIPFDQLIIFATNLDPADLVDEAFLRRIKYKIDVRNPTEIEYRKIFQAVCENKGIRYLDKAVDYVLQTYYQPYDRGLRSCHPRDILALLEDSCRYRGLQPALNRELLDLACQSFFVTVPDRPQPTRD